MKSKKEIKKYLESAKRCRKMYKHDKEHSNYIYFNACCEILNVILFPKGEACHHFKRKRK